MTDHKALRDLVGRATEGPWTFDAEDIHASDWTVVIADRPNDKRYCGHKQWPHNAELIVAAVNAILPLLDEAESWKGLFMEEQANRLELHEAHRQMTARAERAERLLDEVRGNYTRDDDLPNELLPRIDACLAAHQEGARG